MPKRKVDAVSTNEREWQGEVLSWLNAAAKPPITQVSQETGVSGRFPDLIFWASRATSTALALCELKGVETPARDAELIKTATEKCRNLHVGILVTWNMAEAIVWKVDTTSCSELWSYPPIEVSDTKKWHRHESALKDQANTLITDVAAYLREGRVPAHGIVDSTVFIDAIYTTAASLWPLYVELLKAKRIETIKWCTKQGIASDDGFETAARQVVYRYIAKILFYQILAKVRGDLDPVNLPLSLSPKSTQDKLEAHFAAARKIDYSVVFQSDFPDDVPISKEIAASLSRFANSFQSLDLPKMGADIIGRIFESLIPEDEKKRLGQYFTEPWLADLLVAGAIRSKEDFVLDPTCGTGAVLMRAYQYLKHLGTNQHGELLDRLWGNDVADFPTELAMINLFRMSPGDVANFPRVIKRDVFEFKEGTQIEMPPNKEGGGVSKITLSVPKFDAIVGNPPYVRYQSIGAGQRSPEKYKERLFSRFAELESTSDLFAFVFAHSASLLNPGGRIAFVTSNSWLDADYGTQLKKFLLSNFRILAIFESRCEPWFENARVNTVVTVVEKSPSLGTTKSAFLPTDLRGHEVPFVKLKRPLTQIINRPIGDPLRFDEYVRLYAEVEAAADGFEDSSMRVRKRSQQSLFDNLGV